MASEYEEAIAKIAKCEKPSGVPDNTDYSGMNVADAFSGSNSIVVQGSYDAAIVKINKMVAEGAFNVATAVGEEAPHPGMSGKRGSENIVGAARNEIKELIADMEQEIAKVEHAANPTGTAPNPNAIPMGPIAGSVNAGISKAFGNIEGEMSSVIKTASDAVQRGRGMKSKMPAESAKDLRKLSVGDQVAELEKIIIMVSGKKATPEELGIFKQEVSMLQASTASSIEMGKTDFERGLLSIRGQRIAQAAGLLGLKKAES